MKDDIEVLRVLVELVAKKIVAQVKQGNTKGLEEILWNVPTVILVEFVKRV